MSVGIDALFTSALGLQTPSSVKQAKRAARGFKTASHLIAIAIAIAYLRMSKPKHLPSNPLLPALPQAGVPIHRCL